MSIPYAVIEIFTSEEARWDGAPLAQRIVEFVRNQKIAARCIVSRGVAGCYENGEIASHGLEVLSFNMPLKIEIILPAAEVERIAPTLERVVSDGIVAVEDMPVRSHRTQARLLPRQLRVRDAMTSRPISARPDTPLSEILRTILNAGFNGVPIVDAEGRPVGIVTQGDLIRRAGMPIRKALLLAFEQSHVEELLLRLASQKASDVMSRPVATIDQDAPVQDAVTLMLKRNIKRLPVIDSSGRLVGMFSRLDVFKAIHRETPATDALKRQRVDVQNVRTVSDILETDTPTVRPDTPLEEVIRLIDTSDVQRVAVVDPEGRFLGLISDKILLGAFAGKRSGLWQYLLGKLALGEIGKHRRDLLADLAAQTAVNVMSSDVVTLREDSPVDEAIRLMAEKGFKRIPVVNEQGTFVGMVSRDTVLRLGAGRL